MDLKVESEDESKAVAALVTLRDELNINIEVATPDDFIPVLDGWRDRSAYIDAKGSVT